MSPEKQRIAIAEACGWTYGTHEESSFAVPGKTITVSGWNNPKGDWERRLPDYLNDLNAMHEAEKNLTMNQIEQYVYELQQVLVTAMNGNRRYNGYFTVHATATQRAEAFLRTLGKWEEAG